MPRFFSQHENRDRAIRLSFILLLPITGAIPLQKGQAQEPSRLFPPRSLMPTLLAGPRNPSSSATFLAVPENPSAHGPGFEVEISLGTTFPIYLVAGEPEAKAVVVGIEAAAFARFGLQVLEREMVATDWIFAVPVIWHHEKGLTRFRYYHSSSHMGDEYNRRFGDPGINSSRDAVDLLVFRRPTPITGLWMGARYGYNVHPQWDERWVLRTGGQVEALPDLGRYLPFLAGDVEWDQEAGMKPRTEVRVGAWLPRYQGRRTIRVSILVLTGPSPLGQFRYRSTTQIGLSLQGSF